MVVGGIQPYLVVAWLSWMRQGLERMPVLEVASWSQTLVGLE